MPRNETSLEDRQRWMRERHAPVEASPRPGLVAFERHYNPKELASIWHLDQTTVRRLFQDQPGVLKVGKSNRRDGKRDYVSLRIPQSVAERVHRERSR